MKSDKLKNVIIVMLLLIIVMLLLLVGYVYQDKNKDNSLKGDNNQGQEIVDDNKQNYTEKDFIRNTSLTLIEEPMCTGSGTSLIANIEENGNISISRAGGAIMITPGNAKYLYKVGKIVCDEIDLYYITADGGLYKVENNQMDSGRDVEAVKVEGITDVVEFLGVESEEALDGYNHYIKVLLKNGNIEYVKYMSTVK